VATAAFEVELDVVYRSGQQITFYCDLAEGRQLGFIPPTAPEYELAERTIRECNSVKHHPATLAGAVPCKMALPEQRARQLISDGHTWGAFASRNS
jgi:hypothetical protein